MAQVTVTLSQLVDLSLCSTEMGTVNFSLLHALLQVLIQQVNRSDVAIEFAGKDSERIQTLINAAQPLPSFKLTEYKIVGDQRVQQPTTSDQPVVVVEPTTTTPQVSVTVTKDQFSTIQNDIANLKEQLKELKDLPGNLDLIEATRDKTSPILDMFQILTIVKRVDAVEISLEKIASLIEDLINQTGRSEKEEKKSIDNLVRGEIERIVSKAEDIVENVETKSETSSTITMIEESIRAELERIVTKIEDDHQISDLKNNISEIYLRIEELTGRFEQLTDLIKTKLSNQDLIESLVSRLEIDDKKIALLYDDLAEIQKQFRALNSLCNRLDEEVNGYQKNFDAILEQIDFLKITKANHEDLQDALESKADVCVVDRKVSNDVFEVTYEEFSKTLEDTLRRLGEQEQLLLQALDSLQMELGNKLDKAEIDLLREFVNAQLKDIQDKLKLLTSLKKEQEAAGAKRKLMKDLNCISCDQDVVMQKECDPNLKLKAPTLSPTKNIAPYLAYELDQLRKHQKTLPPGKNINHFEGAVKLDKESKAQDRLSNRYCGGSHTITTAEQRVARIGHFLEQWGLKVEPLCQNKYIRGTDNHLYKGDSGAEQPKRPSTALSGRKNSRNPSTVIQNSTATGGDPPAEPTNGNDVVANEGTAPSQ